MNIRQNCLGQFGEGGIARKILMYLKLTCLGRHQYSHNLHILLLKLVRPQVQKLHVNHDLQNIMTQTYQNAYSTKLIQLRTCKFCDYALRVDGSS